MRKGTASNTTRVPAGLCPYARQSYSACPYAHLRHAISESDASSSRQVDNDDGSRMRAGVFWLLQQGESGAD
jgi:hypothetical protein